MGIKKLYKVLKGILTTNTETKIAPNIPQRDEETTSTHEPTKSYNITRRMLASLTPREEKVLRMLGIGEKSDKTLEDVAHELQMSIESVLEIKDKALRKLCHPVRSNKLKSLIDNDPDTIKR